VSAPLYDLWMKSIEFHLYMMFNFTGSVSLDLTRNEAAVKRAISFISGGIETGIFRPRVDRTFKLDDVVAAHQYWKLETRSVRSSSRSELSRFAADGVRLDKLRASPAFSTARD
jgi:NADPH:quinone reductase-like Zn-dependent oxidoreductase